LEWQISFLRTLEKLWKISIFKTNFKKNSKKAAKEKRNVYYMILKQYVDEYSRINEVESADVI
jgi:hypothetical protein